MPDKEKIMHKGIIRSFDKNKISVLVRDISSCDTCTTKSGCSLFGKKEKIITVDNSLNENFSINDEVFIHCQKSTKIWAVLLAYLFPCILLLASLTILYLETGNDVIACLGGLGFLLFYYFILFLFRNKFNKSFSFNISKVIK